MAVGAYTAVVLQRAGLNDLIVTLPAGGATAAAVGFLVGVPSLRLRGFYLALSTLSLHFAVSFLAYRYQTAVGGTAGFLLPAPTLASFSITGVYRWNVLLAVIGIIVLVVFNNFCRSKVGRAWTAIRDRDLAASIIGINVTRYKLIAFVVSSMVAGIAGVLQAHFIGNVSSDTFSLSIAISYIAMIIIGGIGSVIVGSVLGAVVVTQLPYAIQSLATLIQGPEAGTNFAIFDIQAGAFGLVIIFFLLFEPDGLVGVAKFVLTRARSRFSRA
jgi:branched-chain amino acid transport system permease protein